MFYMCDGFALPEDDPKRVETCWSCNILIVKLCKIILRILLVLSYIIE